jgi:hypothetical protein
MINGQYRTESRKEEYLHNFNARRRLVQTETSPKKEMLTSATTTRQKFRCQHKRDNLPLEYTTNTDAHTREGE